MKIETQCLHEGYTPKNGEPRVVPIVQSTTYVYDSSREIAEVFDDPTKSLIYSRFENPTTDAVEKKIAALEGGAAAMCKRTGCHTLLYPEHLSGRGQLYSFHFYLWRHHKPFQHNNEKTWHRVYLC